MRTKVGSLDGDRLGQRELSIMEPRDLFAAKDERRWLEPFVVSNWSRHRICFPHRDRWLDGSYHAVTAERLHTMAVQQLGEDVIETGVDVLEVRPDGVSLADGRSLSAPAVVDGRGDPGYSRCQRLRFTAARDRRSA